MKRKKKETKVDHCAIDPHFESMGDDQPTLEELTKPPSVGELVLWRRVILRALWDFCSIQETAAAKFNQNEAERWFLTGRNFILIAQLADFQGYQIRMLRTSIKEARDNPEAKARLRKRLTWC